jgi:hypothetical protein
MRNGIAVAAALSMLAAAPAYAGRFPAGSPATTNNADSCDLGNFPAATLLLPYFEVDVTGPLKRTLLVTVTNTSEQAQIAKVILWTDWGYPVLDFNLFLTGYDVQALNLADILVNGFIASPRGGPSVGTAPGELSRPNAANPNFASTVSNFCGEGALPGPIPGSLRADVRSALTNGTAAACGTTRIGGVHPFAAGYVTIDVVSTCTTTLPTEEAYWGQLLYDNVLMGDYEQINSDSATGNYAGGNPLVHIRAIPGGGPAGATPTVNLPYTFYDRLTPRSGPHTRDRRQPLPSAFAARFIEGGTGAFNTNLKIWREGATGPGAACADYVRNGELTISDVVRFDEHENPTTFAPPLFLTPRLGPAPATSSASTTTDTRFPPLSGSGDIGGWIYLNLHNDGPGAYTVPHSRATQNWVVVSMSAEGRYAVDYDAASLGNGCSPALPVSNANGGNVSIGPVPDPTP